MTPEETAARFKSFLKAHIHIRSFVNAERGEGMFKMGKDFTAPEFSAGAEKLADQEGCVFVYDYPG